MGTDADPDHRLARPLDAAPADAAVLNGIQHFLCLPGRLTLYYELVEEYGIDQSEACFFQTRGEVFRMTAEEKNELPIASKYFIDFLFSQVDELP